MFVALLVISSYGTLFFKISSDTVLPAKSLMAFILVVLKLYFVLQE